MLLSKWMTSLPSIIPSLYIHLQRRNTSRVIKPPALGPVQNPNRILQETQSRPRLAVRAEVLLEVYPRLVDLVLVGLGDRVIDTVIRLVLRVEPLLQVDEAPREVSLQETELACFLGCVDLFQPGLLLGIGRWAGEVFETLAVLRRRLWWQICFIDSRSEDVQVSKYKLSAEMFDTEIPANTDDANLDPGMSKPPVAAERWTDMTVFLIHCEIRKLSRQLQSVTAASYALPPDIDERLELFQQSQARIEDTYLKHLNPHHPLHSFVAIIARLFLTKVDLILHTKQHSARATEPQAADTSQSDEVFMSSLSIIEYTYALQNEPNWSGWSWQIQGRQPPWHALRVVLGQLCTRRWGPICERAWSSAKRSFDSPPEAARRDPRYQQLLVLASAVQKNRADELHHQTSGASTNAHIDLTSATALTLSAPLAQVGISGAVSTWTPREPFLVMADDSNNKAFSDDLSLETDWQVWDEIARELEPSLEFWDMDGL